MTQLPNRRRALALAAAALLATAPALADTWPQAKPVRWVVAYPAGGGSDFLARQLAPQLGKQLGQTIVIDNRPGAAGIIGTDNAAKSPPDGYTIVTGDNGAMVFHEAMYRKIPYTPGDFAPVGFMARFPLILAVHPGAGFASGRQLLDDLKKNPGKFSYASPGVGSPHHLAMELLKDRTKTFVVHVPYRGTALAVQDVISGQVPMMVLDTAAGLPQIRAGKVKALAVMSKKRIPSLPDVPTLDELGVKDFEVTAWQGLFVPKGTPAEIVTRLTSEMNKAIALPEVRTRLEDFGLEVTPTDGPALAAFIQKETAFWHALIRERRLSAE
jgi:tripartite-type tricarboxylate transporter receptor subunit TctC